MVEVVNMKSLMSFVKGNELSTFILCLINFNKMVLPKDAIEL